MVPLLTSAPNKANPVMIGRLDIDEFIRIHSAERRLVITRARLTEGSTEFPGGSFISVHRQRTEAARLHGLSTQAISRDAFE